MSVEAASPERRFKLVVLGATGVGKTCLTLRFVRGVVEDDQLPTIGAAYLTKSLRMRGGAENAQSSYVYEIWDTAGQERYESITPLYYRTAQAAIIAFDVNDKNSFIKAKDWLARLRKELDNPGMPIALAANKSDGETSEVDMGEAEAFAAENNMKLFRVSAKTGKNVDEMFQWLALNLPPPPPAAGDGMPDAQGGRTAVRPGITPKKPAEEGCC
jgi:Ras-related protein Rab-5C